MDWFLYLYDMPVFRIFSIIYFVCLILYFICVFTIIIVSKIKDKLYDKNNKGRNK